MLKTTPKLPEQNPEPSEEAKVMATIWKRIESLPSGTYKVDVARKYQEGNVTKEHTAEQFIDALKMWIDCDHKPGIDFNSDFTKFRIYSRPKTDVSKIKRVTPYTNDEEAND